MQYKECLSSKKGKGDMLASLTKSMRADEKHIGDGPPSPLCLAHMVVTRKQEQNDDDHNKAYCEGAFENSNDKRKGLELAISDAETVIEDLKSSIDSTASEVATLHTGLLDLDMSVVEATETRKADLFNCWPNNVPLSKKDGRLQAVLPKLLSNISRVPLIPLRPRSQPFILVSQTSTSPYFRQPRPARQTF